MLWKEEEERGNLFGKWLCVCDSVDFRFPTWKCYRCFGLYYTLSMVPAAWEVRDSVKITILVQQQLGCHDVNVLQNEERQVLFFTWMSPLLLLTHASFFPPRLWILSVCYVIPTPYLPSCRSIMQATKLGSADGAWIWKGAAREEWERNNGLGRKGMTSLGESGIRTWLAVGSKWIHRETRW